MPAAAHNKDRRHRLQIELRLQLRFVVRLPEVRMDGNAGYLNPVGGDAAVRQLLFDLVRGDQVFVHFGACPRAVRIVVRNERVERRTQAEPFQTGDDGVRNGMRADDQIRLQLRNHLRGVGVKQAVKRKLRKTVQRFLILSAIDHAEQLRLLRDCFAICGHDKRTDHRVQKIAQFDNAGLDGRIERTQPDGQRVCCLGMSGAEPFGKQQHSFFMHILTCFSYLISIAVIALSSYYDGQTASTRTELRLAYDCSVNLS